MTPRSDIAKPEATAGGSSILQQALEAQAALLPYALATFVVSLPIYLWVGSHAPDAFAMSGSFITFACAWAVFYGVVNWLKSPAAQSLELRGRVHILGGLCWAVATAQIALFADVAGPAREPMLLISLAAAVICIFFTAPWLPSLLVIGPAVAVGPLVVLYARADTQYLAVQGWGAIALAMALSLILNRILRRQFAMAAEREQLIAERAGSVEAASRLAQSKSDLVATLSHEIRNGLTGVAHVLAAATGRSGRFATREQMIAALDAANDLIAVLDTTLDSETADAGRLSIEASALEPVAMIRDLVLLNRPNAAAKGLEFGLHVEPDLASALSGAMIADPTRVRQILSNLVGNALKFTVRGRIEARVERAGETRICIEIADTGPGLTPEELEKAFEPFHRIERTSLGTSGAGLGLSLSRRLARLMGGELSAHSALGVGSCFRLELPYDPAAETPGALADAPVAGGADPRALKILIAEDDALNAAMLRAILEQLGHQVVHAQDGRRAVDLARICEFDVVMIDGRMPVLDGPQAISEILAQPGALRTPIIAVIGGDADEAHECLEAGAGAVLRKPVNVATVVRAVTDAIGAGAKEHARQVA